jgi:predicted extracellular nuclease
VVVIGEWYTIDCATSGLHSATVTGTPALYTINPDSNFFNNELCTITIKSAQVQDEDAEDPYDFMAADYTWSFTTLQCGGPHTLISAIQGSGTTSPVVGTTGVTVEGLVTADFQGTNPGISGFYIQSLSGEADSNPLTSEGLLVYGNSIPASVGEILRLTGTVVEYRGQTELGGTVVLNETCSTGNSLPSPISLNLPDNADQTFTLEPYEGMLATFPEELTLQQNYFQGQYGQITLGAGGRIAQMNNETKAGGSPYDYTRMIILDDASSRSNPSPIPYYSADGVLRAGDTVTGLTGVIDQGPINTKTTGTIAFPLFYYRLNPTSAPGFSIANTRPVSAPDVGGTLTVAGFNTLNYFTTLDDDTNPGPYSSENRPWGAENLAEFDRQEDKLVAALAAMHADVFGLVKLESWDTAATPQALVNALNTYLAGSATYAVVPDPIFGHFDSMTDVNSDYIQVGLIYKTDTVSLVGDSLSVDDTIFDRSPFAQVFESNATGERFVVVANHFRSNDCDGSETGGDLSVFEDGQGCWNARRVLQAEALLDFIDTTLAPLDPDVLVIGDLNAYGDEDPIETLVDGGLINQVEAFVPDEDRYSYVYDGMTGYIDHFLSTGSMVGQVTGVDFFHINADEPAVIDYNNNSWKSVDLYQPHMYRSSDHDPILAGLNLLQHTLFDFMELELLGSLNGTDYSTVYGNLGDGYILPLDQNLQFQYLEAGTYLANKTLANGRYPFYLDETTVPAGFYEYWAAKHVYEGCGGTWEPIMWQIIIGNQPMFYLKVADSELTLIDGMTYLTAHVDTPLRVSGDYPLGDYDFSGIVFDKWGGSDKEDVTITFEGMPDITALELLGSTNGSDWHAAFGTIDAGYTYAINPKFVYQYLDTGTYTVNTSLVDNRYPFYLDETSVPAGFYDYWAAKNVYEGCDGTWEPIMWQIISGQAPMFYLKVAGSEYSLIDGMTFIMYATDAPLRVSGDYPLGTYTFTGTIDGIHFGKSVEEVTITFVRLNQIFMPIITK